MSQKAVKSVIACSKDDDLSVESVTKKSNAAGSLAKWANALGRLLDTLGDQKDSFFPKPEPKQAEQAQPEPAQQQNNDDPADMTDAQRLEKAKVYHQKAVYALQHTMAKKDITELKALAAPPRDVHNLLGTFH